MNTEKAVSLKKKYAVTAVFVSAVLLLGVVCYTVAFAANNKATVYALLPKYGVVSKDGGTENFYYAEECDSFNSKDFECGGFFAYFDENKRQLEIIYEADYCGKDPDGFFV